MSLHFSLFLSGFQPFFENDSHTTLTVDVQGILRLKAGFPAWFSQAGGPVFLFSTRFPVGGCVKVSGGFLYKLPSNMGRSQRSPFQGGSAPFCGVGFVEQNLDWELAPPGSTLASPLSAPLPPKYFTSWEEKSPLRSILPRNSLLNRKKKA